jgi:hypothetical protein
MAATTGFASMVYPPSQNGRLSGSLKWTTASLHSWRRYQPPDRTGLIDRNSLIDPLFQRIRQVVDFDIGLVADIASAGQGSCPGQTILGKSYHQLDSYSYG